MILHLAVRKFTAVPLGATGVAFGMGARNFTGTAFLRRPDVILRALFFIATRARVAGLAP